MAWGLARLLRARWSRIARAPIAVLAAVFGVAAGLDVAAVRRVWWGFAAVLLISDAIAITHIAPTLSTTALGIAHLGIQGAWLRLRALVSTAAHSASALQRAAQIQSPHIRIKKGQGSIKQCDAVPAVIGILV